MTEEKAWEKLMQMRPDIEPYIREWMKKHNALNLFMDKDAIEIAAKDTDTLVIVASPNHAGIDGSKQALCACGTKVWLSPSTQTVLTARGHAPIEIICGSCYASRVENGQC